MQLHSTKPGGLIEQTIHQLHLEDQTVIDLGFGLGALAQISLSAGAKHVLGIEIDTLPYTHSPHITLLHADLLLPHLAPNPPVRSQNHTGLADGTRSTRFKIDPEKIEAKKK